LICFLSDGDVVCRVHRHAVFEDAEVEVGAGGHAGGAAVANELASCHILAHAHHIPGHVQVHGGVGAVHVVNHHIVAAGGAVGGHNDLAGPGGVDGRALGSAEIHAVMEAVVPVHRVQPHT